MAQVIFGNVFEIMVSWMFLEVILLLSVFGFFAINRHLNRR